MKETSARKKRNYQRGGGRGEGTKCPSAILSIFSIDSQIFMFCSRFYFAHGKRWDGYLASISGGHVAIRANRFHDVDEYARSIFARNIQTFLFEYPIYRYKKKERIEERKKKGKNERKSLQAYVVQDARRLFFGVLILG